jgi:hypothetical protein
MGRRRDKGVGPEGTLASLAVDQLVNHCVRAEAPSGDLVILHVPSGVYLRLDGTASTIVDLLVDTGDAGQAAAMLSTRYSIPLERATTDVASVVDAITSLKASRVSSPRHPTVSGAAATVRSWWRLPPRLKVPVIQATAAVIVVEAGIRLTDVARLAKKMQVPLAAVPVGQSEVPDGGTGTGAGNTDADTDADADAAAIATLSAREQRHYVATMWVLDRWLYDGTCLRRALVTGYFLRRHRPTLHLGLIDEGETSHAWIEAEGRMFNAVPISGTFTRTRRPDTRTE